MILTETVGGSTMEAITTGMSTVIGFIGTVFNAMTDNPYLTVFLSATMIGVGVSVFRKLRKGT